MQVLTEVEAVRRFLAHPDHLVFICPHHDVGDVPDLPHDERLERQVADFLHHGDKLIPPQQRFSGFARSLLAGLGVGVETASGCMLLRRAMDPLLRSRPRAHSIVFTCCEALIPSIFTRTCRNSNVSRAPSPNWMCSFDKRLI